MHLGSHLGSHIGSHLGPVGDVVEPLPPPPPPIVFTIPPVPPGRAVIQLLGRLQTPFIASRSSEQPIGRIQTREAQHLIGRINQQRTTEPDDLVGVMETIDVK